MREKNADLVKARSLVDASIQEIDYIEKLSLTEESAATIVSRIYECFRRLGQALLIAEGLDGDDHETSINALLNLHIKSARPIQILSTLREKRHNINYRGFIPSLADLEEVISMKKALWKPIVDAVKQKLN